jgi:hypothetical protein
MERVVRGSNLEVVAKAMAQTNMKKGLRIVEGDLEDMEEVFNGLGFEVVMRTEQDEN